MATENLRDILLAALPAGRRKWAGGPGIEQSLQRIVEAARKAHPGLQLADELFVRFLAPVLAKHRGVAAPLERHAGDLLLAAALCVRSASALAAFERRLAPVARRSARRIDPSPDAVSEATQRLRVKLLVGDRDKLPGISAYDARTDLEAWIAAAALWQALDIQRSRGRLAPAEELDFQTLEQRSGRRSAESLYMKQAHRGALEQALAAAVAELSARDRNVLRMHFVDGLNIEALGDLYGVHRATVARWIARSREALLANVRARVGRTMAQSGGSVDDVISLLRSDLELSLSRLLAREELG